ncbi:MAG: hypothetical protein PVI07_11050, partial [Anaerolineae bacterium]
MNNRHLSIAVVGLLIPALLALSTPVFCTRSASRASTQMADLVPTPTVDVHAYLPLVARPYVCPRASTNEYESGIAYQRDFDNPVRPAAQHADKNIELRGYTL